MPLQTGSRTAILSGIVTVEEAEPLTAWLRATPAPRVNLRDCTHLHTSALQGLLAAQVKVSVQPVDIFLRLWVAPMFERRSGDEDATPETDLAGDTSS